MRMADGNSIASLASIFNGKIQLAADRAYFLNIIEEWDVAEGTRYTGSLRGIIGDGGSGSAAIDEEQSVTAEQGHELGHELRVRSRERALMIVDTGGVGHAAQHGIQDIRNFRGGHAWAKLLNFRSFLRKGFHGEVQHDLVTAAVRVLSNFCGTRMIGEDGQSQGVVQREDGFHGARIPRDIIQNDGQARTRSDGARRMRRRARLGRAIGMQKRLNCGFDFAAAGEETERCQD